MTTRLALLLLLVANVYAAECDIPMNFTGGWETYLVGDVAPGTRHLATFENGTLVLYPLYEIENGRLRLAKEIVRGESYIEDPRFFTDVFSIAFLACFCYDIFQYVVSFVIFAIGWVITCGNCKWVR